MPPNEIGVDTARATSAGAATEGLAAEFANLSTAFQGAVNAAREAAVEPPCAAGYGPFGEIYVSAVTEVMRHAGAIGTNARGGAASAMGVDAENVGNFTNSASVIPSRMNRATPAN